MNIFYLDKDPGTCAKYHADKHVVKMILEYAQLLSAAHHVLDPDMLSNVNIYKLTHKNHPSAVWARSSDANYLWLCRLWIELMNEYTYRYGKHHATERLVPWLTSCPKNIYRQQEFTSPTLAMDSEYIISDDAVLNYRNYYLKGKTKLLKYTRRDVPEWTTGTAVY